MHVILVFQCLFYNILLLICHGYSHFSGPLNILKVCIERSVELRHEVICIGQF